MTDAYWDRVAREMAANYHLDPVMAEHKRRVHLDLLRRWCPVGPGARVVKTDLFEEALGADQVLFDWPDEGTAAKVIGVDLSSEICAMARARAARSNRALSVAVTDARRLPFPDESIDVLFSCSTLDHFEDADDLRRGLAEAVRVIREGGTLALLLDNPGAVFYGLVRALDRRGMIGFRLGETLSVRQLSDELPQLGLEIVDRRSVYHVPRVFLTAFLRFVRAARLNFLDSSLLKFLGLAERWQGRPGQYLSGWYVAVLARKRG